MKLIKSLALAAAVAVAGIAGAASAVPPGLMYQKTYYSDATLTTVVGIQVDRCVNGNVGSGPLAGSKSDFVVAEAVGSCPGGYW
ncbi:hypothetical protein [Brevundimonas sp.]|jgi:hypothetical protein|uniref:hypothetical protein n=1 Tax=Brevundimonas sp. TaxID=1871086 RepID=UPI0025BC5076|nr:hypothetical protein [Brevundimonas sp.]